MRMDQNVPPFMKIRPKMAVFGQELSLLASNKELQNPPFLEGFGCNEACCIDTQIAGTQFWAHVCIKMCHFSTKSGTKWPLFVKNNLFGLRQAVNPPPRSILRVLVAREQVIRIRRA